MYNSAVHESVYRLVSIFEPNKLTKMSRKQLVGTTGQRVQADGGSEVMVEGQEVWEDWVGQTVENTGWRGEAKGQWRAMEQAAVRSGWKKGMERDKVYEKG